MNKRKQDGVLFETAEKRVATNVTEGKKHTLDSDEEDFVDEDNYLDDNDIEGEEDGVARQDGEQKMTAFNMREEMEEGHFDRDGHFIWKNEKEIRDNWLDNIDWQKIKQNAESTGKYDVNEEGLGAESSDSENDEMTGKFDEIETYKKIIAYMKPKETINKALKRLGGADMKLSSVERLKRKKAGTLTSSEDVTNLTALANDILTNLGNMDVYQETYEQIQAKINKKDKKNKSNAPVEAELDMYADDFDTKEKEKLKDSTEASNSTDPDKKEETNEEEIETPIELQWEFKWAIEDDEIRGPYTTSQMVKWQQENYFKPGTMVRKVGQNSGFYSLSRIDFELYE